MWLLNAETFELENFSSQVPRYAILSHTWEDGEVSFQDVRGLPGGNRRYKDLHGWRKIEGFCTIVRGSKLKYAWIDTCCIDKSSSAELQEAINSMWKWYRDSSICIVYLCDFSVPSAFLSPAAERIIYESEFTNCRWFTRGWTLQELLAPDSLFFYGKDWIIIGLVHNGLGHNTTLTRLISLATGIYEKYLENTLYASVAAKMSWASKRSTTREEDMAYCLLGLFNVNMPLLYGEGGPRAFRRLQLEILQQSDDESIFAWGDTAYMERKVSTLNMGTNVLAYHPRAFAGSQNIMRLNTLLRPPYLVTNKGIQITCQLLTDEFDVSLSSDYVLVPLDCTFGNALNRQLLAIPLSKMRMATPGVDLYKRIGPVRELKAHQMEGLHTLPYRQVYLASFVYSETNDQYLESRFGHQRERMAPSV